MLMIFILTYMYQGADKQFIYTPQTRMHSCTFQQLWCTRNTSLGWPRLLNQVLPSSTNERCTEILMQVYQILLFPPPPKRTVVVSVWQQYVYLFL